MIEAILPATIHSYDAFGDPPDAVLLPAEEELVRQVADKRRQEFTTARHCVRKAMERLNLPPVPVLTGTYGEPRWLSRPHRQHHPLRRLPRRGRRRRRRDRRHRRRARRPAAVRRGGGGDPAQGA
ncbi:hypothetical protein ACFSTC_12035 [Nonomuraea ferruginea]